MYKFETEKCRFPDVDAYEIPNGNLSYFYGSAHDASKYCGFESPPFIPRGQWCPGWPPEFYNFHPAAVLNDHGECSPDVYHWVLRKDQEVFLRSRGYDYATAIGSALIYTEEPDIPRLPNSLLVMPVHSLFGTEHDWNFQAYADAIAKVRDDFDYVAVSVHPACMSKGYWVEPFKKLDCEIVKGAVAQSTKSLVRQKWLYRRFEYMTTNIFGTSVPYASYCGAKVSIYGPYMIMSEEEIKHVSLYQTHPEILERQRSFKEEYQREFYPSFFVDHPNEAIQHIDWGKKELGEDCKLSPKKLREMFCWPEKQEFSPLKKRDISLIQDGIIFEKTDLKALETYEILDLAREGDVNAQYYLSLIFEKGLAHALRNKEQAFMWARAAAEQGLAEAMLRVALFYIEGFGVEKDVAEGISWISLVKEKGGDMPDAFLEFLC